MVAGKQVILKIQENRRVWHKVWHFWYCQNPFLNKNIAMASALEHKKDNLFQLNLSMFEGQSKHVASDDLIRAHKS